MKRIISIADTVTAAAKAFDVAAAEIYGLDRTAHLAQPRMAAMALARETTRASLSQIGRRLGRDHTTVASGICRAAQLEAIDADFADGIQTARALIEEISAPPMFYRHGHFEVTA